MKFCPLKIWHCTAPMLYLGTVTEIACAGATMVKVFLLFFLSKKFTRGRSMKILPGQFVIKQVMLLTGFGNCEQKRSSISLPVVPSIVRRRQVTFRDLVPVPHVTEHWREKCVCVCVGACVHVWVGGCMHVCVFGCVWVGGWGVHVCVCVCVCVCNQHLRNTVATGGHGQDGVA